jgi:hypothetical protein
MDKDKQGWCDWMGECDAPAGKISLLTPSPRELFLHRQKPQNLLSVCLAGEGRVGANCANANDKIRKISKLYAYYLDSVFFHEYTGIGWGVAACFPAR